MKSVFGLIWRCRPFGGEPHPIIRCPCEIHALESRIVYAPTVESRYRVDAHAPQRMRAFRIERDDAHVHPCMLKQERLIADTRKSLFLLIRCQPGHVVDLRRFDPEDIVLRSLREWRLYKERLPRCC